MAAPPNIRIASNRSVYLRDDEWMWLEAEAEKAGTSVNNIVKLAVRRLQAQLYPVEALPKRPPGASTPTPSGAAGPQGAKPAAPKKNRTPGASKIIAGLAEAATGQVQIGPRRPAPGARLKKGPGR